MTNHELLDRYVYSVKMLLPLNKRDDIAAEIRSNLLSLLEDEEASLGHPLDETEFAAILKRNGHPMLVASRYLEGPPRRLIGPALLPLYWFVLRGVLALVLAINILSAAYMFSKNPHITAPLLHLWRNLWLGGISAVGWITLMFAVWERFEVKFRFADRWDPKSLPAIPRPAKEPPALVQIVAGTASLILWAWALYSPHLMLLGQANALTVSPAWYALRLPLLLLAAFGIARACLKLTRFGSAEWLPLVRIAINLAGLALLILLLRAGGMLVPGASWDPVRFGAALAITNQVVFWVLVGVCVLSALMCLEELRRYTRRRRNSDMLAV